MALNAETENVTLNVKLRSDDGSEYQTENATLDVKLGSDDDNFERQIENR